jgi:hypothetical protein
MVLAIAVPFLVLPKALAEGRDVGQGRVARGTEGQDRAHRRRRL